MKPLKGAENLLALVKKSSPSHHTLGKYWRPSHNLLVTNTWCSTDNQAKFDINCEKDVSFKMYWTSDENQFGYHINRYGYRVSPKEETWTKDQDNIMFVGCSHTFGIGVDWKDTFVAKIGEHLNTNIMNLGSPGGSLDLSYRLASLWVPYIKPKKLFLYTPPWPRIELIVNRDNDYTTFYALSHRNLDRHPEWSHLETLFTGENLMFNMDKNIKAIEKVAEENDVDFYCVHHVDHMDQTAGGNRLGRDNGHGGKAWHDKVAEHFIGML